MVHVKDPPPHAVIDPATGVVTMYSANDYGVGGVELNKSEPAEEPQVDEVESVSQENL